MRHPLPFFSTLLSKSCHRIQENENCIGIQITTFASKVFNMMIAIVVERVPVISVEGQLGRWKRSDRIIRFEGGVR